MMSIQIIYFWSETNNESVKTQKLINETPYSNVIATQQVDNPTILNMLAYGQYPQASIPFYLVKENNKTTFYQPKDSNKVFNMADWVLREIGVRSSVCNQSPAGSFDGLRAPKSTTSIISDIYLSDAE